MANERNYAECKTWFYKLCPERNNEFMSKTEISSPRGATLTSYDIEQIKKLCQNCSEYELMNK